MAPVILAAAPAQPGRLPCPPSSAPFRCPLTDIHRELAAVYAPAPRMSKRFRRVTPTRCACTSSRSALHAPRGRLAPPPTARLMHTGSVPTAPRPANSSINPFPRNTYVPTMTYWLCLWHCGPATLRSRSPIILNQRRGLLGQDWLCLTPLGPARPIVGGAWIFRR